jgi:hypothetical protein
MSSEMVRGERLPFDCSVDMARSGRITRLQTQCRQAQRVQYITKLYNSEFHVLARNEIKSYDDLKGRLGR